MSLSVFVAGHNGMVGSSIVRLLSKNENINLILASREDLDLTNSDSVYKYLETHKNYEIHHKSKIKNFI